MWVWTLFVVFLGVLCTEGASQHSALKKIASSLMSASLAFGVPMAHADPTASVNNIEVRYDGVAKPIKDYINGKKAILVLNVASQCALTPQYEELVDLGKKEGDALQILAFPCNQFGSQEPAPVDRIRRDMKEQFGFQYPIFDKIDVNGPSADPLFKAMKNANVQIVGSPQVGKVSWNFEKFLLDESGSVVRRYKPGIRPEAVREDIEGLIKTGTVPPRKKPSLNDY